MGPFVVVHLALVGFFACAGLYAAWTWWSSRQDRTLLVFAAQCLLCSLMTIGYVGLARADTPERAWPFLAARLIVGLSTVAVTAALVARLTGVRATAYVRALALFAAGTSIAYLASGVHPPAGLRMRLFVFPWGEAVSVPVWGNTPWWFALVYAVVLSANTFGVWAATRMARRDRVGALLVGLATVAGLITTLVSMASDFSGRGIPYLGNIPFTFWVLLSAFQLSREYARQGASRLASEQQFRSLFDGLEVGVVMQDAQDRIVVSNPAAARMLGLTEAQLQGISSRDPEWRLVREDGTDFPLDEVPSVVAARRGVQVRNAVIGTTNRQTGARVWLQVTATPTLAPDGSLAHVIVTLSDVTYRKLAEEALRASERRLALAISATSDAVWEWNDQTGEAYYSPRWFAMLGYATPLPSTRDTWTSLVHPDDLAPTQTLIQQSLDQPGSPGYDAEYRMKRADGTWIWVRTRGNVVERDEAGRARLLAGTTSDITARREAESKRRELETQLARSHRMEALGRLAGGIAHDFNNLLTVINGYSDLLLHTGRFQASTREMLTGIREAGDRAAGLTRQLLAFSRHRVAQPDTLDIVDTITNTERMLRRLIGEQIHIQLDLPPAPVWVCADPSQLGQLLLNLVLNARDAMPGGGTVTIGVEPVQLDDAAAAALGGEAAPGRFARLSVRDTGTGIPPELHGIIFEPFFTTKGSGHGTGLGLSTVHGIVRQCHGFVTLDSAPGRGSVFATYLPLADEPVAASEVPAAGPAARSADPRTILLAEDDDAVRPVVDAMLQHLGFQVLVSTNGKEALEHAARHEGPIDLLLTDVLMPELTGPQLAAALEQTRPGTPVLYMSGYANDAAVRTLTGADGVPYLQKPFDADTLARHLDRVLGTARPAALT